MRLTIGGRYYRLKWVDEIDGGKTFGECDPPDSKEKEIRIVRTLRGEKRVETIIHECLHACHWDMDENWVSSSTQEIAHVLESTGCMK